MVRTYRIFTAIVALTSIVAVAPAIAKGHHHQNGQQLLGEKIKTNGEHRIHKVGKHTVAVQVASGKVAGLHVTHSEKGDVPVKKYKTKNKMAQTDGIHWFP